jgi:hypothetical protein
LPTTDTIVGSAPQAADEEAEAEAEDEDEDDVECAAHADVLRTAQ